MNKSKKWVLFFFGMYVFGLFSTGMLTVIIDPFFHFHQPLNNLAYPLYDERYQNNGIIKHFDYDAIITGSSMIENFKKSEFDEIFGVNSIKVPFYGSTFKEINDNLEVAINANSNIKVVVRSLDCLRIFDGKDAMLYNSDFYPLYLYNTNPFDDVKYVFNKSVFLEGTLRTLDNTISGEKMTDFDTYANWMDEYTFGKEAVDSSYVRPNKYEGTIPISIEDYNNLAENFNQNIIAIANENPEIEFYLFFPPYSIYYWDSLYQQGTMERYIEGEKYVTELCLESDNIHIYSFHDDFDMVCNLDNYKDYAHYSEDINSKILIWMSEGEHLLTKDNYEAYYQTIYDYYTNYNYDSLYERN